MRVMPNPRLSQVSNLPLSNFDWHQWKMPAGRWDQRCSGDRGQLGTYINKGEKPNWVSSFTWKHCSIKDYVNDEHKVIQSLYTALRSLLTDIT